MHRPRVLHISKFYPPDHGGIESAVQMLARSMSHWGRVSVLAGARSVALGISRDGNVRVIRLLTPWVIRSQPIIPGFSRVLCRLLRKEYDLIHFHLPNPLAARALLAHRHLPPLIVTYHSAIVRQRVLGLAGRIWHQRLLARAGRILVSAPQNVDYFEDLMPFRASVRVVPYSIEPGAFELSSRIVERVRQLEGRFGQPWVLFVGRLVPSKGVDVLIRAMAENPIPLLIVGDGPERNRLERLSRRGRGPGRVHIVSGVSAEELGAYYHGALALVLPSVSANEAFGIVQLEAMACGKPVINTALPTGVPWVSPHMETGLTVPPGDHEALALAIRRLEEDPELRQRLGENGRKRVEEHFSLHGMVGKVVAIYEETIGMSSSPAPRPHFAGA